MLKQEVKLCEIEFTIKYTIFWVSVTKTNWLCFYLFVFSGFGSVDIDFKQLWPKTVETTPDTLPESSAPPAHLKSVVVRIEADSSNSAVDTKTHVKEPSKKRRRSSDSEDSDSDPLYTPPLTRERAGRTPKRKRHRKSPDRGSSVGSTKKTGRKRQRSEGRHKQFKGFVIRPRELNLPSRVVNDAEGGLQITILRGQ